MSGVENITGSAYHDTLIGDVQANRLAGLGGNDTLQGGSGADTLDGGAGLDTADYTDAAAPVTVSLSVVGVQDTGGSGVDVLASIEALKGSAHGDRLTGSAGADTLEGAGGNDVLEGGTGIDVLDGGTGADRMVGGSDGDQYRVDNEYDVVEEGPNGGADAVFSTLASNTMAPWVETLVLLKADGRADAQGNDLPNTIIGNGHSNSIHGGPGTAGDNLHGGAGDDFLSGGEGSDTLGGGAGTDVLFGGGTSEADLFVFEWEQIASDYKATGAAGTFIDTYAPFYLPKGLAAYLYDFHEWDGDRLDLRAIDADLGTAGDQAFRYVGTAAFTGAGQVRIQAINDHVVVEADVDGGGADWKIALAGAHPYITADTFLL